MYKVISCSIFKPYIEELEIKKSEYIFTFLPIRQHNQPQKLSHFIQQEIDQTKCVDKIILLYGLCGNALLNIHANDIPVIVVSVHDCMSILLGSKERYNCLTKNNPSLSWSCYSLKKENYINDEIMKWEMLYDKETVEYLKKMLIPEEPYYISFDLSWEQEYIETEKKIIKGDLHFLKDILLLKSKDILYLNKNQRIKQSINNIIEISGYKSSNIDTMKNE